MGANQSGREAFNFDNKEVNFDHFHILRAIGKGSFGKVCIVQKKDTKQMFAMKYMNKAVCMERDALRNVLREVELLTQLEHPFLVNIWFSFQDEEDLFMVSDLLLGGDLRYHIQHQVNFSKESFTLMIYELATALDYLHGKRILHRDIKPDNILLDEEGHAHITDFNIATQLSETDLATSMSGTKPYMGPEIFDCAADECVGYSYPVDWWSLGIVAYEMLTGKRPYDIHSQTSVSEVRQLFQLPLKFPFGTDKQIIAVLRRLLCVSPGGRCSTLDELKILPLFANLDHEVVFQKRYTPAFCPSKDHLNCDPTFELEEMIVETKPLHKKKKRLAKQKSMRDMQVGSLDLESQNSPTVEPAIPNVIPEFITYNRYIELERKECERIRLEREMKEAEWEKELSLAMGESLNVDSKPSEEKVRSQDGCDILEAVQTNKQQQKEEVVVSKSEKPKNRIGKLFRGANARSIDETSSSNTSKFGSEGDFFAAKKKSTGLTFDCNIFGLKDKSACQKNLTRSCSLRTNSSMSVVEPECLENDDKGLETQVNSGNQSKQEKTVTFNKDISILN